MNEWIVVCQVKDIPVLGSRRVSRAKGLPVAVFRNANDEVFALLDRCPHRAGPLSQGIVHGRSVTCPLHNWTIGLANGCANAPDEGQTPAFQVRVNGDEVWLRLDELDALGVEILPPMPGPCRVAASV